MKKNQYTINIGIKEKLYMNHITKSLKKQIKTLKKQIKLMKETEKLMKETKKLKSIGNDDLNYLKDKLKSLKINKL